MHTNESNMDINGSNWYAKRIVRVEGTNVSQITIIVWLSPWSL